MKFFLGCALTLTTLLSATFASAADIDLKILAMRNVDRAIEVCGSAVEPTGIKPLLITIEHGGAFYSTMSASNDIWCTLIGRRTFSGKVAVTATTLDGKSRGSTDGSKSF